MKRTHFLLLLIVAALSGCADQITPDQISSHAQVGFWYGLWHGIILPIAWVVSLFDPDVAIYAAYNNGGWYDFGFVLGVGGLASSSSTSSK